MTKQRNEQTCLQIIVQHKKCKVNKNIATNGRIKNDKQITTQE